MSAFIDKFRVQPFDLAPVYAEWKDAPRFKGGKKDPSVDAWLQQIKDGCKARKVPKESWHRVAIHLLDGKARKRFEEVQKVMDTMHGGKYVWSWKSFKVALCNMGWDVKSDQTEQLEVQSRPSGFWNVVRRRKSEDLGGEWTKISPPSTPPKAIKPAPQRAMSFDVQSLKAMIPTPKRSSTMATVETVSSLKNAPAPSTSAVTVANSDDTMTMIANAPAWLLNACTSLDFLAGEHPKAMTALSAILITVGSIPALPAISAGAGGAFLASGTAHAIGSIAVGLGALLQATSEGKVQVQGQGQNAKS